MTVAFLLVPFIGPAAMPVYVDLSGFYRAEPDDSWEESPVLSTAETAFPEYPTSLRVDRGWTTYPRVRFGQPAYGGDGFTASIDAYFDALTDNDHYLTTLDIAPLDRSGFGHIRLGVNASGQVQLAIEQYDNEWTLLTDILVQSGTGVISAETWHYFQLEYDGDHFYVYADEDYLFRVPVGEMDSPPDVVTSIGIANGFSWSTSLSGYLQDFFFTTGAPEHAQDSGITPPGRRAGIISGTVEGNSNPVPRQVFLHREESGTPIGAMVTGWDGAWACWAAMGVDHYAVQVADIDENAVVYTGLRAE